MTTRFATATTGLGHPSATEAAGVYLHFPFCACRCTYCDFATVAGQDASIGPYLRALATEIGRLPGPPRRADTVFLGGGTPSRMRPEQVRAVLGAVRERFALDPRAEITLEANPESLDERLLDGVRAAGVTRISIGVQSLDDAVLARVGRAHDARQALDAVRLARRFGGLEVNADLIIGLPGEELGRWSSTVARIAELEPEHCSVYMLELDKPTPLARAVGAGRAAAPEDEALVAAYEETVAALAGAGLGRYEISNFARPERESRHNLKYWTDAPYAGFGLGAHGYLDGSRRANVDRLGDYLAAVEAGRDPAAWHEPFDRCLRLEEALIGGLRLAAGVDLALLGRRYGEDLWASRRAAWSRAAAAGLIEREGDVVRLTERGIVLSNELFAELLGGRERAAGTER